MKGAKGKKNILSQFAGLGQSLVKFGYS